MRYKKIYLLYPNCGYCVYYMIQYKVISKKYKKEAVFLGKVLEYAAKAGNSFLDFRPSLELSPLLYCLTFISATPLSLQKPKVLSLPTDLEAVSP